MDRIAFFAVDGLALGRFEGNLAFFSAGCACSLGVLARRPVFVEFVAVCHTILSHASAWLYCRVHKTTYEENK